MITNEGKLWIRRYQAGQAATLARSIAVGIGTKAGVLTDQRLQFEVSRVDLTLTSLDAINNAVIYKAVLPDTLDGVINEAAIFSSTSDSTGGQYSSMTLTSFDSDTESWVDPVSGAAALYSTAISRIGGDSLRHAPAASTSESDILNELVFDLSGYSGNDIFIIAYNIGNANTAGIEIKFLVDSANYYTITLGAQTAGYKFTEVAKSSAVATGTPNWGSISAIQIKTTSSSAGASQVDYEGIRIQDVDSFNPDSVMIARQVLATPFVKELGKTQEIEYALKINV